MREQLIQYVSLLFAGAENCEDTKQEILQNTLDRYDDLIAEGKTPEAAYRLAITGIGDINEILFRQDTVLPAVTVAAERMEPDTAFKKLLRAIAVGLYILCPLPLIVLCEIGMPVFGLCGLLCFVAVATVLIILGAKKPGHVSREKEDDDEPKSELGKSISSLIWAIGLALYFIISFATMAWYITWLIFPIIGAVQGLVRAILDLKEAVNNEA